MRVVNPNNTNHDIVIIPRWEPIVISLNLYDEHKQTYHTVPATFLFINGYLTVNFDYTFTEGQKFQIKIIDEGAILYRGKLIATTQEPQDFKASKELYYYE